MLFACTTNIFHISSDLDLYSNVSRGTHPALPLTVRPQNISATRARTEEHPTILTDALCFSVHDDAGVVMNVVAEEYVCTVSEVHVQHL